MADRISTDRQVSALKPRPAKYEIPVAGARGLAVRVYPSGAKAFELRYINFEGQRRRMVLGAYPGLSLAEARERAGSLRVGVHDGKDPAAERALAKSEARTGETLAELAEAYWPAAARGLHGGRRRPKTAKTVSAEMSRFKRHIAPTLGGRRFAELQRRDIREFMRRIATESGLSPDGISSIGTTLSSILAFAVHEDRLEYNPATGLTKPLASRTRERMFSEDTLGVVWRSLVLSSQRRTPGVSRTDLSARIEPETSLALRFLLLTLTRRAETAGAMWREVDERARTWTAPSERMKARRPHVVPLSDAALAVLHESRALQDPPSPYCFPSPGDPHRPIAPDLLSRALTRTLARHGLPHGSPHDFRRSGATTLTTERYGVRRFIVSKVLAHTPTDGASMVTAVYDRNDYLADKRVALDLWGAHVTALTAPAAPGDGPIGLRGPGLAPDAGLP